MRAGFAEIDVTPTRPVFLAGYPGRDKPSEGADDPLFLRVVALEDAAGRRVVLVTCDLLKFPRNLAWRTKLWAQRELGLPSAALIINTSHTHSAPGLYLQRCYPQWPLDTEYLCRLEEALREALRAAVSDLQPGDIRYGLHQAHFGVSRRLPQPEHGGRVRMGANPEGYYDPDLPVLAFYRGGSEAPVAVLYSYACHPTSKNSQNLSADWPGQVSQGLKAALGEGVLTAFAQGAGASIMPRQSFSAGAEPYSAYWRQVAAELAGFIASGPMADVTLNLTAVEKEFFLPYDLAQMPTEEELLALAGPDEMSFPDAWRPANRSIMRLWAQDLLEWRRTGEVPAAFRMHLTRWQLAPGLQLVGMSGEVTAEVGRAVKSLFAGVDTIFLGYCSYTDAYIPTAAMLPEGGHEALCSVFFHDRPAPFTPEIDAIIASEVRSVTT